VGGGGACEVFGEGARGMNVSEYGCCTGCGGFGEGFGEILAGVLDAGGGVFSHAFGSNLGEGAGGGEGEGAGAGGPVDPAPDPRPLPLPLFPLLLPLPLPLPPLPFPPPSPLSARSPSPLSGDRRSKECEIYCSSLLKSCVHCVS
jgi:hypothetical protein